MLTFEYLVDAEKCLLLWRKMSKCNKCALNEICESFDKCKECIQHALDKPDVIINNVLAYVNSYRGASSRLKIHNVCIKYFSEEDLLTARTVLFEEYNEALSCLKYPAKRVGSKFKTRSVMNMEDIFEAFDTLDSKSISVICAASNIIDLPKYNPEEVELTSMLERIINIENKLEEHSSRLDENYARVTKNKSEIDENKRNIANAHNEVQTSIKIANETRAHVDEQKSDVNVLKDKIESDRKPSYAGAARGNRSNARNVKSHPQENRTQDSATDRQNEVKHPRKYNGNRPPSRYGTTVATDGCKKFGMPLPSRYVVIERIVKGITKQDIYDYVKWKNNNIPIRSIKVMAKADSYYERYLVEVSLEHFGIINKEDFWQEGVRVRVFRGNGRLWKEVSPENTPSGVNDSTQNEEH